MYMIKRYISDFTGIAISLIALGVAAGVVFGDVLFVGAISDSFIAAVTSLGDAGAVGVIVLAIIVAVSD
jgi:hypothetical protein